MSSASGEITHISDTALMVAACRAHETELEDAFERFSACDSRKNSRLWTSRRSRPRHSPGCPSAFHATAPVQ